MTTTPATLLTVSPLFCRNVPGGVHDPSAVDKHALLHAPPTVVPVPAGSQKDMSSAAAFAIVGSMRYVIRRFQPSVASVSDNPSARQGTTPLASLVEQPPAPGATSTPAFAFVEASVPSA